MGYGIDKSGWLIARFAAGQRVPVELLPRKTTAGRR